MTRQRSMDIVREGALMGEGMELIRGRGTDGGR